MVQNSTVRALAVGLFAAALSFSQVQNAADASAGLSSSSPIAPGSLAFVTDYWSGTPSIGGSSVSLRLVGSSALIPAQVENATSDGITFLVPPDAPIGNVQVIYKQAGQLTQWTGATIEPFHFVLYRDPVRAVGVNSSGAASPNGLANPAQPGQAVEIFATAPGVVPQTPPQVTVGGVAQSVLYFGSAGAEPGVIQINFQIAPGTPDGCYLPLNVIWGTASAFSYISKTSDGMPCHHPFGLSVSALNLLDQGMSLQTGMISMTTALTAVSADRASRQENASVTVQPLAASDIARYFTANSAQGCGAAPSGGFVGGFLGSGSQLGNTMTLRNATTTLTLASPNGFEYTTTIPPSGDAPLNALQAPIIGGGQWTWSSSGGSDLAASNFSFNLAPPIQINGGAPVSITSSQDQTISWNGTVYDSNAILQLSVSQILGLSPPIVCFAPAQDGALTIRANLLARFTIGGVGTLSVSVTESGAGIPAANFTLSDGSPLLMLVSRGSTDTRPVDFK
jgi:uncharacterized protein (TIGR03437 family)